METNELIATILGVVGFLFGIVKYGVHSYSKATEKTERLKARLRERSDQTIRETMSSLQSSINHLDKKIIEHTITLQRHSDGMSRLDEDFKTYADKTDKAIELVMKATKAQLKKFDSELNHMRIVKLENGDFMITRGTKNA